MGGGRGGDVTPVRSVAGNRGIWTKRNEQGQDMLVREMGQLIEGKKRLRLRDHTAGRSSVKERGPGSARGSRINPELRSELETLVHDIIGGSDMGYWHHRWPFSWSVYARAVSDGLDPRTTTQAEPRDWCQNMCHVTKQRR
ncbi:hypothetical protein LZ30DRAFT_732015 [Colletotrichum cereale]|nr:hypothetical protein LZ30DRAFT_732015 [Colletotrichum cereale]